MDMHMDVSMVFSWNYEDHQWQSGKKITESLTPALFGLGELTPHSSNDEIFYLPGRIKFANFKFIFAIRNP